MNNISTQKIILILIGVIGVAILLYGVIFITGNRVLSSAQAIKLVQDQNPDLRDYPSENLPPKTIETKEIENGWQVGFYMNGSGRPGILAAKCFLVTHDKKITSTGEFVANTMEGPANLNLTTCKAL